MVLSEFFCPDNDPVCKRMHTKLTKMARKSHVSSILINTTRVVLHEPPQFNTGTDAVIFSICELLQNATDQMKHILLDKRCKLTKTGNRLTWKVDKSVVLDIFCDARGFDLEEICLPLSLDCIGSGTGQKPMGAQATDADDADDADDDADDAGGFGDGSKTGFHALLYYGYSCQYIFLYFDATDLDRVVVWDWGVRTFDGFSEPHMAVDITVRSLTAEECTREQRPTMITRVRKTDNTDKTDKTTQLEPMLVYALCYFESIMYKRVADPRMRSISSKTHGSWDHRCTFEPLVDEFLGFPIALPSDPDTCLVLVGGIFYKFNTSFAPLSLVVCIPGKGVPGSPFPVFNNQMREPDTGKLRSVFAKQFHDFRTHKSNINTLTTALLPLLEGGTSLLYQIYPHTLLNGLLYDHSAQDVMRKMLLFKLLSPREWGHNEAEQRKRVLERVDETVLVTEHNLERARWYQFVCGKRNNVVVIDAMVANSQLFHPAAIDEMECDASRFALANATGRKNTCVMAPREVRTAIKYIAGKDSDLKVVRVYEDPGDGIQPYDFRFTTRFRDVVVIYQPKLDMENLISTLGPHMRESKIEASRAMQFCLHFHGNTARRLAMSDRVKHAIGQATKLMPYDIGEDLKRPRDDHEKPGKEPGKEPGRESDSSDSEENPLNKFINKKFKVVDDGKGWRKKLASNPPRIHVPPDGLKSISRGHCGVGGGTSTGPAPDTESFSRHALEWNAELGVFLVKNESADVPETLVSCLARFHRCIDMLRDKVDVGRCQAFPCYSPNETWKGLHRSDGSCMINLALVHTSDAIVGTTLHEVAHEYSQYHDIAHGRAMQRLFEEFVSGMLF